MFSVGEFYGKFFNDRANKACQMLAVVGKDPRS